MRAQQQDTDEVRQWERDWREGITVQVRDIADNTTKMGLVVREMQGDVKDLMEWKADVAKRKDNRIEQLPMSIRDWLVLAVAAAAVLSSVLPHLHWIP